MGHTTAKNRIGTVPLPEGYTEPGACNQIRYSSERYACHYSLFTPTSAIKGANCVECKLLHCEYRASKGVDYQSMPLQCIGVFWFYMFPTCNLDDFGIKGCGI